MSAHPPRRLIAGRKGGKGGGRSQRTPVEEPNTLRSRATARVVDLVSAGPIGGLVDGLQSVYYDETPLQNADGTRNFSGVAVQERVGTASQAPLSGIAELEATVGVGAQVTVAAPVIRTISDPDLDAVRVTSRIPALQRIDVTTGDRRRTTLSWAIDLRSAGGAWVEQKAITRTGKNTAPYEEAHRIALAGDPPWDIRMRRLTPDSDSDALQNDLYWSFYTTLIDDRLTYDDTAVYGTEVDAEQFGDRVPGRAYRIDGLLIRVPDNYDPVAGTYDGIWTGGFQSAVSGNPAWILYYLLTDPVNGLGDQIDASAIDVYQLYDIGRYCDELVPDGFGGTERRYQFRGVINTAREAAQTLAMIAAVFRGMIYEQAGAIHVVADMPADPTALVTRANVEGGSFQYATTERSSRHSVALVTWSDPDDFFKPAVEVVEGADAIRELGWKPVDLVALGCASRGQAKRVGKWLLDSEKSEGETATYRGGFDQALRAPGDIAALQDSDYAGVRFAGRLAGATATTATLDAPVTLTLGETYTLMAVLPSGAMEERAVTDGPGETSALTLSAAWSAAPLTGAVWVLKASNVAPRTFRIVRVAEVDPHRFETTAVLHDPTKYARVEQGISFDGPAASTIPTGPLEPPRDLTVDEYQYPSGKLARSAFALSWSPSRDPRVKRYQAEVRFPDSAAWEPVTETIGLRAEVLDTVPGTWGARVRSVDGLGRPSTWLAIDPMEIYGQLAEPVEMTGLTISTIGGLAILRWDLHPDLDVQLGGEIRFRHTIVGDGDWSEAVSIGDAVPGATNVAALPLKAGTYLARAVDAWGIPGPIAKAPTAQASVLAFTTTDTLVENPVFAGAKTDMVVADGALQLTANGLWDDVPDVDALTDVDGFGGVALNGSYRFAGGLNFGAVQRRRITTNIRSLVVNALGRIDDRTSPVDSWPSWDGTTGDEGDASIWLRLTNDDPAGSPVWGPWHRVDSTEVESWGVEFEVRVTVADESYNLRISELGAKAEAVT